MLFKKETAEQARNRIRNAIQSDNNTRLIRLIIRDGFNGFKRDKEVYKVN